MSWVWELVKLGTDQAHAHTKDVQRRVATSAVIAGLMLALILTSAGLQISERMDSPEIIAVTLSIAVLAGGTALVQGWKWGLLATIGSTRVFCGSVLPAFHALMFLASRDDEIQLQLVVHTALFFIRSAGWRWGLLPSVPHTSSVVRFFQFHAMMFLAARNGEIMLQLVVHTALFFIRSAIGRAMLRGRHGAVMRVLVEVILVASIRWRDYGTVVAGHGDFRRCCMVLLRATVVVAWLSLTDVVSLIVTTFDGATVEWPELTDVFRTGLVAGKEVYQLATRTPSLLFCRVMAALRVGAPLILAIYALMSIFTAGVHVSTPTIALGVTASMVAILEVASVIRELTPQVDMANDVNFLQRLAFLTGVDQLNELAVLADRLQCNANDLVATISGYIDRLAPAAVAQARLARIRAAQPVVEVAAEPAAAPAPAMTPVPVPAADEEVVPHEPSEIERECIANIKRIADRDVVIGFFGATNSGKSSIIRALLGPDHAHFDGFRGGPEAAQTRELRAAHWYSLPPADGEVEGRKVWLVDIPGYGTPRRGLGQRYQRVEGHAVADERQENQEDEQVANRLTRLV